MAEMPQVSCALLDASKNNLAGRPDTRDNPYRLPNTHTGRRIMPKKTDTVSFLCLVAFVGLIIVALAACGYALTSILPK